MIYLIGFGSEGTFQHVSKLLSNIAHVIDLDVLICQQDTEVSYNDGVLRVTGYDSYNITFDDTIYHRVFIRNESDLAIICRLRTIYDAFEAFCFDAPLSVLILNRLQASAINQSKLAQLSKLHEIGFQTPLSFVSNNSEEIVEFSQHFDRVISKGMSGIRTEAVLMDRFRLRSFPRNLNVPVLAQEYIDGFDVRAHFVGLDYVAQKIVTKYVDYRYAERFNYSVIFEECVLPSELYLKCLIYMSSEFQEFAAFDFRVASTKWYLLEVNPMPGYSYFDRRCAGKISALIHDYLRKGYSNLLMQKNNECFVGIEQRHRVDTGKTVS